MLLCGTRKCGSFFLILPLLYTTRIEVTLGWKVKFLFVLIADLDLDLWVLYVPATDMGDV
jgi:hypothetical protein